MKKKTKKLIGRPISDPFRKASDRQGSMNVYTKRIPAKDWERFVSAVTAKGMTHRFALIRFVQLLPENPKWMEALTQ